MRDGDVFFDTSVLLYLLSADIEKADRVEELVQRRGVISIQVLNECAAVALRKHALSVAEVREVTSTLREFCRTHPLTLEVHEHGLEIAERSGFQREGVLRSYHEIDGRREDAVFFSLLARDLMDELAEPIDLPSAVVAADRGTPSRRSPTHTQ